MQAPLALGHGQCIGGQRKVVHAHVHVSSIHEGIERARQHGELARARGQLRRDDAALWLETLWQVRVGIQRDAVRPQLRHLGQRAVKRLGRLARQAVDQIHIHRVKAQRTRRFDQRKHLLGRLDAVHSLLHFGIKVLHAKTQPVKTQLSQQCKTLCIDGAGVHLDGVFPPRREREAALEHGHQLSQARIGEEGGCASPQVQLTHHLSYATVRGVQVDLAAQVAQVDLGAVMVLGDDLVAGAVVAQGFAKRDVHVQGQRHGLGQRARAALLQRQHIVFLTKRLHETVGRWIGCIAGPWHVKAAQKVWRNSSHGEISLRTP